MNLMQEAFLTAALRYIDSTHFGYHLQFHIDEAVDVAVGHFLSRGAA